MKRSTSIAALLLLFATPALSRAAALDQLYRADIRLVTRLRGIDAGVIATLTGRFGKDQRFADRGAAFSSDDAMSAGYNPPSRRLVIAAATPQTWFIHYLHGGRGLHSHLVAFARQGHGWRLAYSGVAFHEYDSLGELREAVRKHQFRESDREL